LQNLNVEVLAISTDSHFTHKAWQEQELSQMIEGGAPYPLLSDPDGSIGKAYNVYDDNLKVNLRGKFLIDPQGVLQAMEILNEPVGRNMDELVRQVEAFQYISENEEEAAPAGWEKGKQTLKPAPGLVGKVHESWSKGELE